MSLRTIIAPASAAYKSGVIVVRISGANSLSVLQILTQSNIPKPRNAVLRKIYDSENQLIDNALIIYFSAPNSFTGEDVVEFHLHGSIAVLDAFIKAALATKLVELANPGEFTRQAFENHKMELTEVEGLADLIDSETQSQLRQSMRQMQGELGTLANLWREKIIEALSEAEAYIDFPDEDLPLGLSQSAISRIKDLIKTLEGHIENSKSAQRIRDGFYIAIIGKPNAGKSSLLNALARREAAIVSPLAGTTRDIVEISMHLGGYLVFIADTAGLRDAENAIEAEGIKRAIERAKNADLRIGVASNENEAIEISDNLDDSDILLFSKSDLSKTKFIDRNINQSHISIVDGEGLNELESKIISIIKNNTNLLSDAPLTRIRHVEAVKNSINALENALNNHDAPTELICEDLRIAARFLGELTGTIGVDDILDKIFSSFCIGK